MSVPNTIMLKTDGRYDEGRCDEQIYPGHLVERKSNAKYRKQTAVGGNIERAVAIEDGLQGRTTSSPYAADELLRFYFCKRGDEILLRLQAGQNAADSQGLMSAGDGSVIAIGTGGNNLYTNVADSATITNTAVETAFDKKGTIPANFLKVGDEIHVRGSVALPATNGTDTLTLKLKIGATLIVATAAVDVANGDIGYIDAVAIIRAIGAVGSLTAEGETILGVPGTAVPKPFNTAATAIDTTVSNDVAITATWSVANAGNQAILKAMEVDLERTGGGAVTPNFISVEAMDNSAGLTEKFVRARVL